MTTQVDVRHAQESQVQQRQSEASPLVPPMGNPNAPMAAAETAVSSVAAQAQAAVQARYVMALNRPRSIEQARHELLRECRRPGFAEVVTYRKPIGRDGITGPSIRLAETAMRCMTNFLTETTTVFDADDKRIVRVSVTDLESNITQNRDVTIRKEVERRQVRDGQEVLGTRANSYGDKLYIVRATEDDLLNKEAALVSKAMRTCALRLIPGDLIEEAIATAAETKSSEIKRDPDSARRKLLDGFARLGIDPSQIEEYLGHSVSKMLPEEQRQLLDIGTAIKEGESRWSEVMEHRREQLANKTKAPAKAEEKPAEDAPPYTDAEASKADELEDAIAQTDDVAQLLKLAREATKLPPVLRTGVEGKYEARRKEIEQGGTS